MPAASIASTASSSSSVPASNSVLAALRAEDVGGGDAAENALAQRLDHFAAFDQRLHRHAVRRAAIVFGHDEVLRHVDQAAREVARVRRLQRRVGQTLARAVRRDEVLQHVQAFAEVRRDRRLDDRAVGLRHQAAHAGELPDLRRRAARARVGHHVDRVERLLHDLLALRVLALHELARFASHSMTGSAEAAPSSPSRCGRRRGPRCRPPCCSARPG